MINEIWKNICNIWGMEKPLMTRESPATSHDIIVKEVTNNTEQTLDEVLSDISKYSKYVSSTIKRNKENGVDNVILLPYLRSLSNACKVAISKIERDW